MIWNSNERITVRNSVFPVRQLFSNKILCRRHHHHCCTFILLMLSRYTGCLPERGIVETCRNGKRGEIHVFVCCFCCCCGFCLILTLPDTVSHMKWVRIIPLSEQNSHALFGFCIESWQIHQIWSVKSARAIYFIEQSHIYSHPFN